MSHLLRLLLSSIDVLLDFNQSALLVRIKLPPALSTLGDLGTDVASIYTSVKGLVLAEHRKGRLPAQLPRRTC